MKFNEKSLILSLCVILLLSSCTSVVDTPTPAPIVVNTSTTTPSPSATPENTPTPTSMPAMQCIPISYEQPVNDLFSGSLVLGGYQETYTYLLDLASWQLRPLIDDQEDRRTSRESVSPDHKWLAYYEFASDSFVVNSPSEGKKIKLGEELLDNTDQIKWNFQGWFDNQNLLISFYDSDPFVEFLLNPFNNERTDLVSSFPDQIFPMTLTWADVIYNPSLTRLVYPTYLQEIILWDTQEVKVINSFHSHPILHTEAPVWSPDGNQVVIRVLSSDDYGSALLLVSKDGDVKVLLKSEEYSITEDSDSLLMTGFSWSPDQNKIAFWLTEPYKEVIDNTETKLAVINLDNQAVNIYCIYGEDPFISPAPLWSPDGNSVALAVRYDFGDGNPYWTPTIILFDFEKAYLFPMEDDFSLAGWLE
jgi:hypothetical protein